jgi:hypothetical protein
MEIRIYWATEKHKRKLKLIFASFTNFLLKLIIRWLEIAEYISWHRSRQKHMNRNKKTLNRNPTLPFFVFCTSSRTQHNESFVDVSLLVQITFCYTAYNTSCRPTSCQQKSHWIKKVMMNASSLVCWRRKHKQLQPIFSSYQAKSNSVNLSCAFIK